MDLHNLMSIGNSLYLYLDEMLKGLGPQHLA